MSLINLSTSASPNGSALVSLPPPTGLGSPHRDPFNINEEDPLVLRHLQKITVDDVEYLQMSDFFAGWVWFHLVDLADRIQAASHGYLPGTSLGPVPTTLLADACSVLGLEEPRVFEFLRNVQYHNPIQGRWPTNTWRNAWDSVQRVGREAVDWLERARARTRQLNGGVRWMFDKRDLRARAQWLALQKSSALVVHPIHGAHANASLIPYRPESPYFDMQGDRAMVPHPIYGSSANAALVSARTKTVGTLLNELNNPCRAMVLHPLWSSQANNQMVLYENDYAPDDHTMDSDDLSLAPPNSPEVEYADDYVTYEDVFGSDEDVDKVDK